MNTLIVQTLLILLSVVVMIQLDSVYASNLFEIQSPKQQLNDGIEVEDVLCKSGYSLMLKSSNDSVMCVKPSTAMKLEYRQWGQILVNSQDMLKQILKIQQSVEIESKELVTEETFDSIQQPIEEIIDNSDTINEETIKENYSPEINPTDFVSKIDNQYFTLTPGITFLYISETEDGTERIEVTTLEDKRIVMGVETTIVWDRVWLDEKLIEDTKDWYAQDKDGNVWYFGENSKEYSKGLYVGNSGSWEAGIDGALPGIVMKADPEVGDVYRQEYYEGIAEDMGEIVDFSEPIRVSYGYYTDCIKIKDTNPLEPDVIEFKYYCSNVGGVILEEDIEDGETVELYDVGDDSLMTNITHDEAKKAALLEIPGTVTYIETEGFRGVLVYAVEIMSDSGIEMDVFVDIKTGKVLGSET